MKKYILATIVCLLMSNISFTQIVDVLTGIDEPNRMFSVDDYLYFGRDGNKISRIDLTLATPIIEDVVINIDRQASMLVDGDFLYFNQYGGSKVSKIDLTMPDPPIIDLVSSGLSGPNGIAINGTDLYFSESTADKISKIDLTSSDPVPEDFATGFSFPAGLVIIDEYIYVADIYADEIVKINLNDPSDRVELVTGLEGPVGVHSRWDVLYFCELDGDRISKVDVTSSTVEVTLVQDGLPRPSDFALIGTDIYVCERQPNVENGGRIYKIENLLSSTEDLTTPSFSIYPNPTVDYLSISNIEEDMPYNIISLNGKTVLSGIISTDEKINLTGLIPATYVLQLNNKWNKIVIKK